MSAEISIVHGIPLSEEPSLGVLTLPGYLRAVTEKYGSREALVMHGPQGVVRWSYTELWERAIEIARALRACGVGKDSRVGVLMTNRPEFIAAAFGATLAGGVAVTLSTFSTAPELEYLLQASSVSVLLFERNVLKKDFAAILTELEPEIGKATPDKLQSLKFPFLRHLAAIGEPVGGAIEPWNGFLARAASEPRALIDAIAESTKPSDAGVLFFSSGSTSKPKGILSSHRGVCIQLWRWMRLYGLEGDVRCWTANGFFWSGNFGMALGSTFTAGGALILQATFDAAEALDLMQKEKVNFVHAWPHQMAQLEAAPNWNQVDLSALRFVDVNAALARHPTVKSTWDEPRAAYGNTETFTLTTCFPSGTPAEVMGNSHGEPLAGVTLKIVDPMTGAVTERGQRGEICVKGPTLMLGYIGIPMDETLDAEGFLRTGDGGYIDERGRLFWEGRLSDIIKTGGANVSPVEIDETLKSFPGIKAVQTVGVPHDTLGELVVSCVVPHEGAVLEEAAIRDFLKQHLASYKVPRRVIFFGEQDLSQTGNAKIKTSDLRELAAKRLASAAN